MNNGSRNHIEKLVDQLHNPTLADQGRVNILFDDGEETLVSAVR